MSVVQPATWHNRLAVLSSAAQRAKIGTSTENTPFGAALRLAIDGCTLVALVTAAWLNAPVFLIAAFLCRIIVQQASATLVGLAPTLDVLTRATKTALFAWRGDTLGDDRLIAEQWSALEKRLGTPADMTLPLEADWTVHAINVARLRYHGYGARGSQRDARGQGRFYKVNTPYREWVNATEVALTMIECAMRHAVATIILMGCMAFWTILVLVCPELHPLYGSRATLNCVALGVMVSTVIVFVYDIAQSTYTVVARVLDAVVVPEDVPDEKRGAAITPPDDDVARLEKRIAECQAQPHFTLSELIVTVTDKGERAQKLHDRAAELGYDVVFDHCVHNRVCLKLRAQ